jgi:hypothetical protein
VTRDPNLSKIELIASTLRSATNWYSSEDALWVY